MQWCKCKLIHLIATESYLHVQCRHRVTISGVTSKEWELTVVSGFALTFLSGIIFTFCTCPVVSKICLNTSSVTLGSSPPTYSALLLGSGAARRGPPLIGEVRSSPPRAEVTADGSGLLFCGMLSGGGMWLPEPF